MHVVSGSERVAAQTKSPVIEPEVLPGRVQPDAPATAHQLSKCAVKRNLRVEFSRFVALEPLRRCGNYAVVCADGVLQQTEVQESAAATTRRIWFRTIPNCMNAS